MAVVNGVHVCVGVDAPTSTYSAAKQPMMSICWQKTYRLRSLFFEELFLAMLAAWLQGGRCRSVGRSSTLIQTEISQQLQTVQRFTFPRG